MGFEKFSENFLRRDTVANLKDRIGLEDSLFVANDLLEVLRIKEVPSIAPLLNYLADEYLVGKPKDLISARNSCYFYGGIMNKRLDNKKILLNVNDFAYILSLTYSLLGGVYTDLAENTGDILASYRSTLRNFSNKDPKIIFFPERALYNPRIIT